MTFLSSAMTFASSILLIHSFYSVYEHNNLSTQPSSSTQLLPIDILIELIGSAVLLILSLVLSAQPLRPIQWADWAGKIEREGWDPSAEARTQYAHDHFGASRDATASAKGGAGNPFRMLDDRKGFWDVRAERKTFADWVREGGEIEEKK